MASESADGIIVFAVDPGFSVMRGIRALLEAFHDIEIDVLSHQPRRTVAGLVKRQARSLLKHSASRTPYRAWDVGAYLLPRGDASASLDLPMR